MAPFDIAIYGNGFVGSALALALAKRGFSIGLVGYSDIAKKPEDIRAFALGRAAKSLLSSVNAWPDSVHATPVLGMAVYGDKGGAVEFGSPLHSKRTEDAEPLNWIVDVPALTQRLGEQAQFGRVYRQLALVGLEQGSAHRDDVAEVPVLERLVRLGSGDIVRCVELDAAGAVLQRGEARLAHDPFEDHAARDGGRHRPGAPGV